MKRASKLKEKLKAKQIEFIIKSSEYNDLLKELCKEIKSGAKGAKNEASIASIFEIELFSFIKDVHNKKFHIEKEKTINTERHVSKGRIDSKIGALVFEFKDTKKLKTNKNKQYASSQLTEYLQGLYKEHNTNYYGVITDGTQCKFIDIESGVISEGTFSALAPKHLDKIIKDIVLLNRVALSPENLVRDFCSPRDSSLSKNLTLLLYSTLKNTPRMERTISFST